MLLLHDGGKHKMKICRIPLMYIAVWYYFFYNAVILKYSCLVLVKPFFMMFKITFHNYPKHIFLYLLGFEIHKL